MAEDKAMAVVKAMAKKMEVINCYKCDLARVDR